ncbi:TonB-dependent receptor [Pseudokordiimonas caeni]|uniref:TonB-dependent receptor n=1 Tax=Pseudokordiimonas caeni TaxID=2997908 RepID=UPI00281173DB|nr:TonB-dependent receptor [Pseudokordiimonas caeni]
MFRSNRLPLRSRRARTCLPVLLLSTVSHAAFADGGDGGEPPHADRIEEIVVSTNIEGRTLHQTVIGTTVLREEEIARQMDGTLGETLRRQPGISSTFFGPGASRPVIRGLGGDRIRVLDSGIGSVDASSTSPDHAVAVEPALAERIEILRGTSMLVYGSSATGGVINVMDGRIPDRVPENGFEAGVSVGHSTVNDGEDAAAAVNVAAGKLGGADLVLHLDGSWRDSDDYKIPGFAESQRLRDMEEAEEEGDEHEGEEEAFGIIENSFSKSKSASAGLSLIGEKGFIGVNVKLQRSDYGIPAGHHHHEEEGEEEGGHEEEAGVAIDLDQTRVDLMGEYHFDDGWFEKAKVRFGYGDYEHAEIEGNETGTIFANKGYEARLDLIENLGGNWSGTSGVQVTSRDFSAIGDEAFVPPTKSHQYGLFTLKNLELDNWHIDFGGRLEHTTHKADELGVSLDFTGFSASAGLGYDFSETTFAGINIFRTERAPTTEELFSNGPHLATSAYELGDVTLGKETAQGIEASAGYRGERFSGTVNAYITRYDNFIYEVATGEEIDELTVFSFKAADARFMGFEAQGDFHAASFDTSAFGTVDIHLTGQMDLVRAKLLDVTGNDRLPRIPPLSALVGFEVDAGAFDFRTELEIAGAQKRTSEFEIPTDSYAMWNAYLSIHPFEDKDISLDLKAMNLTNSDARQHTSFLKDSVPLPGRNFRVGLRAKF